MEFAPRSHEVVTPQAVVLAAGRGSRLSGHIVPKPLHVVLGTPLIGRTLRAAAGAGVGEVLVVVGYRGEEVEQAARDVCPAGLALRFVPNPEWELSNGVSVLAARPHVRGPFLLLMADHVLSPGMMAEMARVTPPEDGAVLAVDRDLGGVFDMDDATKVLSDGVSGLRAIGKELAEYDCVDTGLFTCTAGLFDALSEARSSQGDCSLSDGIRVLAARGRMRLHAIAAGEWWQDVDTPEALQEAERRLAAAGAQTDE